MTSGPLPSIIDGIESKATNLSRGSADTDQRLSLETQCRQRAGDPARGGKELGTGVLFATCQEADGEAQDHRRTGPALSGQWPDQRGPSARNQGKLGGRLESLSAGDVLRVAAALDQDEDGNYVVIITAYCL